MRFKWSEDRAAARRAEQQLLATQAKLEGELAALTEVKGRCEREAASASNRARHLEQQLNELYELCTSQQGTLRTGWHSRFQR